MMVRWDAYQSSVGVASEPYAARVDDANGTTCLKEKVFNAILCSKNGLVGLVDAIA